ncbi:MAG: Tautomerase enzyme [Actinomycetota bacterium]|nr:Tautomerase enzyme [Actinomycetota bacterium]
MPMLDAYIPAGALSDAAEEELLAQLTDLLIINEGADPSNPEVRSIAWLFVHRPEAVFVAGSRASTPRYRFIASVPEGQYDGERRAAMVHSITEAVLDAEQGAYERDPARVWVFTPEVPDGTWGALGRVVTLADIATFASGDPERGRRYAEERLAERRIAPAVA